MQVDGYRQSLHNFKTIKWNDKVVVSRRAAYTTLSLPRLCRTSYAGLSGLSDHARLFANPVSCSYNRYQSCVSKRIDFWYSHVRENYYSKMKPSKIYLIIYISKPKYSYTKINQIIIHSANNIITYIIYTKYY